MLAGTTEPDRQVHPKAASILNRVPALRARIDSAKTINRDLFGHETTVWAPEQDRIDNVIIKNARGHAFFEYGEPMLEPPTHVASVPLSALTAQQFKDFETMPASGGFPEVGSRMLTRVLTGQDLDGDWVVVQDGIYRYSVAQVGTLLVRSVIFEYLAREVFWR